MIWRWRKSNSLLAGYFLNFLPHKITFLTCPSIYFKSEASYVKLGTKTFLIFPIFGPLTIKMGIIIVEHSMLGSQKTPPKGLGHFCQNPDPNKTNIPGVIQTIFSIVGTIAIVMNHFQVLIQYMNGILWGWRLQVMNIMIMNLKNIGDRNYVLYHTFKNEVMKKLAKAFRCSLSLWSKRLNFETNISYFGPDPIYENYEVIDVDDLYNKVIYSNHQKGFLPSVLMYFLLLS